MSEEKNVQKRVVNTQTQPDNTFERVLSHMGVIERHFKDDLNWIDTISKNDALFATVQKEGVTQQVLYSRMLSIWDDIRSLQSMKDYLINRYGIVKNILMDTYDFGNSQEFLLISLQNDIDRLIYTAKGLLEMYNCIIENSDEDDDMPSVDFHALTKQREEEMKNKK